MAPLLKLVTAALCLAEGVLSAKSKAPAVQVKNGTLEGKYVASYDQDLFLGVPFAQPPVGSLRFQNPQSLNETFGTKKATEYADSCVGYGNSPAWPHTLGEDCLTLNIVRPANSGRSKLPVGVWIHGGGWSMDYSANGVYNLSFIVEESVKMGKPFIAVSVDYRLSFWGFLASQDILDAGVANLGLKDQRIALHWIKENIGAFGGDTSKITIWGESAGGGNVGYQATAYGGKDEGLFRGLIAQSGADGTDMKNFTNPQKRYDTIVETVGCDQAKDKLACLREVPFEKLNATITKVPGNFYPVVDGDFVLDYPSALLSEGKFTKVPFLLGTNADEGTLFGGSTINTDEEIAALIQAAGPDANTTEILMALYPNIDALGLPAFYRVRPDGPVGKQFKRAIALSTDQLFLSWRRLRTDAWSKFGVTAYSYLFESPTKSVEFFGTTHFTEIGYVFYNKQGLGYAGNQSPLKNATKEVLDLAKLVTRMWISFINDLDPNKHGISGVEKWPTYKNGGGYGENFYFNPNGSSVQPDTFRLAGTSFMNSVSQEQYGSSGRVTSASVVHGTTLQLQSERERLSLRLLAAKADYIQPLALPRGHGIGWRMASKFISRLCNANHAISVENIPKSRSLDYAFCWPYQPVNAVHKALTPSLENSLFANINAHPSDYRNSMLTQSGLEARARATAEVTSVAIKHRSRIGARDSAPSGRTVPSRIMTTMRPLVPQKGSAKLQAEYHLPFGMMSPYDVGMTYGSICVGGHGM
ncbi:neuroligin [Fusarium albosuccineum]|uniref:Neuroligin n=1 Tax=Fusarium albosuccineum TaxID=1237068 RepID=A0A8H4LE96_9HYPO|nr:neuroligin [Fusarium albosuccineum]